MNPGLWLTSLFTAIDSMDAEAFARHLTADAVFQFGNLPPVKGTETVTEFVGAFFKSIRSVHHEVEEHWTSGDTLICRGGVTYLRHDGRTVSLPFANIMKLRDGKAFEYVIFADASPLYASGSPH